MAQPRHQSHPVTILTPGVTGMVIVEAMAVKITDSETTTTAIKTQFIILA